MFKKLLLTLIFTGFTALNACDVEAHALSMEVFNPGEKSIFPVSSEIISGKHEVALIDAQFQRDDAEELVKKIKATGKKLTTVYISHSDPDFYFGLDVIKAAFRTRKLSLLRVPLKTSTPLKTANWPTGGQSLKTTRQNCW